MVYAKQLKVKSYQNNKGLHFVVVVSGSILDYVISHLQKNTAFVANCSISRCFCSCFTLKAFCNAFFYYRTHLITLVISWSWGKKVLVAHSCSWLQKCFSFWQAGIICQLNARTSILAAANPIESQWNPKKTTIENIQLPHTLLSRYRTPACMSHFYEMLYFLLWRWLNIVKQNNCVPCSVMENFNSTYF